LDEMNCTGEQITFLSRYIDKMTYERLAQEFNTVFKTELSSSAIRSICNKSDKVPKKTGRVIWSGEKNSFLRDNIHSNSYGELRVKFNNKFGVNLTKASIEHACRRIGINHGHTGVRLRKGEKNQFSPSRPIGSETESAGKIYVKVSDDLMTADNAKRHGTGSNWIQKNRFIYESVHGTLPEGFFVLALDGNRRNFEIENLYATTRRVCMLMGVNKWFSKDREITLAAIKWCELFYALKGAEKGD